MGLDLGQLGHGVGQTYSVRSRSSANTASSAPKTGCDVEQPLLVAEQPDVAVDERLLGVEVAGRHGDRGVPRLLHADVLGVGDARSEAGLAVADLEVVGDVALRPVADDLGEPDLVGARQLAQPLVGGDGA